MLRSEIDSSRFQCENNSSEARVGNETAAQHWYRPHDGQIQLQPNDDKFTVDCMFQNRFGAQVSLNSLTGLRRLLKEDVPTEYLPTERNPKPGAGYWAILTFFT